MKNLKVLIVDDDNFTSMMIEGQLSNLGYNCSSVKSGTECLSIMNEYDIVLLDYFLEFENGLDILQEIKKKKPILPVILLSSQELVSIAIRSIKFGAFDYIEKCHLNYKKLDLLIESAITTSKSKKRNYNNGFFNMNYAIS